MEHAALGVAAGLLCLGVTLELLVTQVLRRRTWTRVEARVRRVRGLQAQLTFQQPGGRRRTATHPAWPGLRSAGRTATLRHDPGNAFRTQLLHPMSATLWSGGLLLLAAGGLVLLALAARPPEPVAAALPTLPWSVLLSAGLALLAGGGGLASRRWRRRHWSATTARITATSRHTARGGSGADRSEVMSQTALARRWVAAVVLVALGAVTVVSGVLDAASAGTA